MTATPAPAVAGRRVASAVRATLLALGLPALLVAAWWLLSEDSSSPYVPPLREILAVFDSTWLDGRLVTDVVPSLLRLAAGYGIALVAGVGGGIVIGAFPWLRALSEPVLEFFRAIPPPVLVPILMLVAGFGTSMKVAVIVSGCLWPILLNTIEGVRGIDEVLKDVARSYRITRLRTIVALTLRGASPQIVTGARQALSIGIILMVISEMFAANNGIGFSIVQFQRTFALREMWTGIILLGLLGVALSVLFRAVERPVLRWHRGFRQAQRGE